MLELILIDGNAGLVELADTLDLGSSAARFEGSSPLSGTKQWGSGVIGSRMRFKLSYLLWCTGSSPVFPTKQ